MKKQLFGVLTILLLIAVIFMLFQLDKRISNVKCPDGDCKYDRVEKDELNDLTLSLKLNDDKFRPLHLDLVNDFGILVKAKAENDTIKLLTLRLKEVGSCENYTLIDAKYEGSTDLNDKEVIDATAKVRHHMRLTLNHNDSGVRNTEIKLNTKFKIKKGDEIDVHFKSDVCTIPITEIETDGPLKITGVIRAKTYFGNNICKAQVQ